MPYQISWQEHGVTWHYSGVLTGKDLMQSNFDIFGDERFDDIRYQIVDLTGVEEIQVTEQHMRKVAHLDMAASRSNPRVKVAVVSNSEAATQLNVYYDKYCDEKSPWETRVFGSIEEAEAWVGQS